LAVRAAAGFDAGEEPAGWVPLDGARFLDGLSSPVILELKCPARMPGWMAELVRRLDLRSRGFSKYGKGVLLAAGEGQLAIAGRQAAAEAWA
jgi:hypothetical protein